MAFYSIPDRESKKIRERIDQAEKEGFFDRMFCKEQAISIPDASSEMLIQSINPAMHLTKNFFLRIYGYEISRPGFAEQAMSTLAAAGCSRAREYYNQVTQDYGKKHEEELKGVVQECATEDEKMEQKGSEEQRLREMSSQELLELLRNSADGGYR